MSDVEVSDTASEKDDLSPEAMDSFLRLKNLLHEMFQLDRGDLDFGLYRIMNLKRAEITSFLDNDLLPRVKEVLGGLASESRAKIEDELEKVMEAIRFAESNPEESPRLQELTRQLQNVKGDAKAEVDIYNHLANFFTRYYNEGDFMSLRRYSSGGRASYLIPYDGEEVKLHWANSDQYYVKTTENYSSYTFTVDGGKKRVRFEIAAADNEKDNVKEAQDNQRRFLLARTEPIAMDGKDLVIRFEHRPLTKSERNRFSTTQVPKQSQINESTTTKIMNKKSLNATWQRLLSKPAPTDTNAERSTLDKHLETYTTKNSFDYFIHKDLSGFLRRELDLYLKTEVLNVDDLVVGNDNRLRQTLVQMRSIRQVADKIITLLAQLEDFQKRLWLKKKFVLETQWCVTLDCIPEQFYPEIVANAAQHAEWVELYSIDKISNDSSDNRASYSNPLTPEFIKDNAFMMLDTKHFDEGFTDRLLSALSDAKGDDNTQEGLERGLDGLLVYGENFQGLGVLSRRYHQGINCIYIDPPYNTDASEIMYKNGYRDSSWLSLMSDRLMQASYLLDKKAAWVIAIDDVEESNLSKLLDSKFPNYDRNMVVVNHHPAGAGLEGTNVSSTHEYSIFMTPKGLKILRGERQKSGKSKIGFTRTGTADSNLRSGRPNSFYAILVDPGTSEVVGVEPPPEIGKKYPTKKTGDGYIRIYPVGRDGTERVWRRSYESVQKCIRMGAVICENNKSVYLLTDQTGKRRPLFSNWTDKRYNAGTHGSNLLKDFFGTANTFSYPKSINTVQDCIDACIPDSKDSTILDYFAGSGTTAQAVINLNRKDNGNRRYILVEFGDHFDTVILPRIKKSVYSSEWKEGVPVSHDGRKQIIKYIRIESYEDTLNSIEVRTNESDLLKEHSKLSEDYQLRYELSEESSLSPCLAGGYFNDPFSYTLSVVRDGTPCDVPVDLPETFNYLLGLRVKTRKRSKNILEITGVDPDDQECLILWRNLEQIDNHALDNWIDENRQRLSSNLGTIYVNGDHTLNALRSNKEKWTAKVIEPTFRELMFNGSAHE